MCVQQLCLSLHQTVCNRSNCNGVQSEHTTSTRFANFIYLAVFSIDRETSEAGYDEKCVYITPAAADELAKVIVDLHVELNMTNCTHEKGAPKP